MTVIVLCCTALMAAGQDIITLRDGKKIEATVTEVSDEAIKYKRHDYPTGPTYTLPRATVEKIIYANGTEEVFSPRAAGERIREEETLQPATRAAARQGRRRGIEVKWAVHAGAAFPIGKFGMAETKDNPCAALWSDGTVGAAATGGGFGVQAMFPIKGVEGLSATAAIDMNFNGIQKAAKDTFIYLYENFNPQLGETGYDWMVNSVATYINMPVTAGVNYTRGITPWMGLWVEGGIGVNFRFLSKTTFINNQGATYLYTQNNTEIYSAEREREELRYTPSVNFAYRAGIGAIFAGHYTVGVHFYGTTGAYIRGKDVTLCPSLDIKPVKSSFRFASITPMMFVLRAGYVF